MNKRINLNIKDRKILYAILVIVLVSVFSLTIAYAALSTVLTITGNAEVTASDWDIHFDNIKVNSGSVAGDAPEITSSTTATFSTILNMPGEYYEFTIDVVNDGTIDAMIENITKTPTLTASQAKYLKYEITYQNGDSLNTQQLVEKNSFVRLKVRVEFRNDLVASDLPTSQETLQLGLQLDYTQSNGSGSTVSNNGRLILSANGNINTIGTIVTIGDQQFYTIGTEDDNVKLLSMMNITLDDNPTQSSSAGTTAFSNTGTNYNGSIVEVYVNNYKARLESNHNVDISEARLITIDELTNNDIGCNTNNYTCSNAPSFIHSTTYWSGSASDQYNMWVVYIEGELFDGGKVHLDSTFGVRPVIIISKDYFPTENRVMTFTIAGTSYKALEGMTWAEWLKSDYAPENAYSNYTGASEVISVSGYDIKTSTGTNVTPYDTIIEGHAYINGASSEPA